MSQALFKSTLVVLLGNGFSKVALLGFELLIAWNLGAGLYGRYTIGVSFLMLVSSLALCGLEHGIVQYLSVFQEEKRGNSIIELVRDVLGLTTKLGLAVGLFIALTAPFISRDIFHKPELTVILRIIGFTIPFEVFNQAASAVFRGFRAFKDSVVVSDLIRNLLLLIYGLSLFFHPLSLHVVFSLYLFGSIAASCVGVRKLVIHMAPWRQGHAELVAKRIDGKTGCQETALHVDLLTKQIPDSPSVMSVLREVLKFSGPLFFWNVFQKLAGRSQVLLAGLFLSEADVGAFGLFLRLILVFTFFQTAVNQTLPVEFARLNHLGERDMLRDLLQGSAKALLVACVFLSMPLVVNPTLLLQFFGSHYGSQGWMLTILVFAQVINVGTGSTGQLLIGCRKQSSLLMVSLVCLIIQVTLSFMLLPSLGLLGAVIAEAATNLSLTFGRQLLTFRLLKIHSLTINTLLLLLGGIASASTGFCLATQLTGLVGYVSGVVLALACCSIFLTIFSFRDRSLQIQILGFLKRRR